MNGVEELVQVFQAIAQEQRDGGHVAIGTLLSRSPPSVRVGRLTLDGDRVWINAAAIYVPRPELGEPPNPDLASPGDRVLVVSPDGQTYVVVCKVVR